MNIVVLDGYTLNPGDLSWTSLERLGHLTVYDRTRPEDILERSAGAQILLTNKTPLSAETIAQLPDLQYIGVLATGYNVVDVQAAAQRGIIVTNIPDYGTNSVAQFVFALLLQLCSHVQEHSEAVRAGEWTRCLDFTFTKFPQIELENKTMGIIGYGRIGQQTAHIAKVFGMKVLFSGSGKRSYPEQENCTQVEVPELLEKSDVVSLHCPLTPHTEGLINKESLSRMKATSLLINTARGGLIVEQDLADALNQARILGAGLDVLSTEPPREDNPLLTAKNCIITPHIAWATREARARLLEIAVQNIKAFLQNSPVNTVR